MTTTTRHASARNPQAQSSPKSSPNQNQNGSANKKRKAETENSSQEGNTVSSRAKKGKMTTGIVENDGADEKKEQTKIDEFVTQENKETETIENDDIEDEEMREAADKVEAGADDRETDVNDDGEGKGEKNGQEEEEQQDAGDDNDDKDNGVDTSNRDRETDTEEGDTKDGNKNNKAISKAEQDDQAKEKSDPTATTNDEGAVEESEERKDAMPSNILEKGIIYFFVRGRVGIDDPQSVQDIARSFLVLRPLPQGAKLGDGPIDDLKNNRLCALPKKVLPRGHKDVFMTFVEKAGVTVEQLKKDFMEGSTYTTQTTGVRHTPNVTPVGEGVYAITSSGRSSHLAYMLTIPSELGEVQKELGLTEKGSFVVSVKNPESSSNANADLPEKADFPQKLMDNFRGRAWAPLQPQHLDYPNCQFLLIGDGHGDFGKALEPAEKDKKKDEKETPQEEIEKLQGEDEERVQGLKEDDAVFEDLGISHKDYPKVPTTW